MRLTRASRRNSFLLAAFLLVLVACGNGDDGVSVASTSGTTGQTVTSGGDNATSTTVDEVTTTTAGGATTTTVVDTVPADAELEKLLLPVDAFGPGFEAADVSGSGFDPEYCPGQSFQVRPTAEASLNLQTTAKDEFSFVGENILRFDDAAAKRFIGELEALDAACRGSTDSGYIGVTLEPLPGLGDEAVRGVPTTTSDDGSIDLVVVRSGNLIILLIGIGPEPLVTDAVVAAAVSRVEGG